MTDFKNASATTASTDTWQIGGISLTSRFLLGTAGYPSPQPVRDAIVASGSEILTLGIKRTLGTPGDTGSAGGDNGFVQMIRDTAREQGAHLLPNTAGCRSAREAITLAHMARELLDTNWIKLEVVGDEQTLQPDPFELVTAARQLVADGFVVLPYCTDDLVSAQRLADAGCEILMPWAAPIGSGLGLLNPWALRTLRARLPHTTLIVDAGLGAPSHATAAMELGMDAVLLNSAVSQSLDPVGMARAFKHAVKAGRRGHRSGLMPVSDVAVATTPVGGQPFLID
jgi:thiazole synthase